MHSSPRTRRLHSDFKALKKLADDSSIFQFSYHGPLPEVYTLHFKGKGFWRSEETRRVLVRDRHDVRVRLGASYPRQMPELSWKTPIFHPNISANGSVCLGGYGTHWVPSLSLDELCNMLWEMIRYANFDVESPYNRDAAHWARTQMEYRLPIDSRSLRDRIASRTAPSAFDDEPISAEIVTPLPDDDVIFLDDADIIPAHTTSAPEEDILFLE